MVEEITLSSGNTTLGTAEQLDLHRFTVPSGNDMKIWEGGISDETGGTSTDWTIEVYNNTATAVSFTENTDYFSGSPYDTLAIGGDDISIRMNNSGTATQVLSSELTFTIE